jgi:hypothetical protein
LHKRRAREDEIDCARRHAQGSHPSQRFDGRVVRFGDLCGSAAGAVIVRALTHSQGEVRGWLGRPSADMRSL